MKLIIKDEDLNLKLHLPTGFCLGIINKVLKHREIACFDSDTKGLIIKELKKAKKTYKKFVLVDIEDSDGSRILIEL